MSQLISIVKAFDCQLTLEMYILLVALLNRCRKVFTKKIWFFFRITNYRKDSDKSGQRLRWKQSWKNLQNLTSFRENKVMTKNVVLHISWLKLSHGISHSCWTTDLLINLLKFFSMDYVSIYLFSIFFQQIKKCGVNPY